MTSILFVISIHQFTNSQIHQSTIFLLKYLFIYLLFFFCIEIIQPFLNLEGHQNAFHSIIKIIKTPNFVKKYLWIGENELVN